MLAILRQASAASKFLFVLSLCLFAFSLDDWRALLAINLVLAAILCMGRLWDKSVSLIFLAFFLGLPALSLIFLLGGIEEAPTWREGLTRGLQWLLVFALRLFVLVLADILVVKLTSFSNMVLSLRAIRLPDKITLFVSTLVGLMPRVFALGMHVLEIQRSRGLEPRKLIYPRNLLALFTPVFLMQMRQASDLALSLELRGVAANPTGGVKGPRFGVGDTVFLLAGVLIWTGPLWNILDGC